LWVLRQTPFFAGLSEGDVSGFTGMFRDRAFSAGEAIYVAGDKAASLYVVATGKVKLVRTTPAGKSVVLTIVGAGDFFGSLSTLGDDTYPNTAVAHTDCCVLAISGADFRSILRRHPQVAAAALDIVAARLRAMHDLVEQLSAYPAEQRIAAALLTLADKMGETRGSSVLIQAPLSRQV
jgi:CRP-like cAMP-binding protein